MTDDILEEVYETRKRISKECGYDLKKLADRFRRAEEECRPELLVRDKVARSDPEVAWPPESEDADEEDEIVREVRAARAKIAAECEYDLKKLGELIKRSQEQDPSNLVTEVPPTESEVAIKADQ